MLKLYVDTSTRRIISSPKSSTDAALPGFVRGDKVKIALHFLTPSGRSTSPYDYVTPPAGIQVALGKLGTIAALCTVWTASGAGAVSVTRVLAGNAGVKEIQRVSFTTLAYGGSFVLGNVIIPYNATASEFQAILETQIAGVKVTSGTGYWDIQFPTLTAQQLLTTSAADMVFETFVTGTFDLATTEIATLVGNNLRVSDAILEIQYLEETFPQTVQRSGVTVQNELISTAPVAPAPGVVYVTDVQLTSGLASKASQASVDSLTTAVAAIPSPIKTPVSVAGSRALVLTDAQKYLYSPVNSAALTIPLNATVAFATGTEIDVFQAGAGQISFVATGGVTIVSKSSHLKLTGTGSGAVLKYIGADTWHLVGDLAA
jgi:hypothetical protein